MKKLTTEVFIERSLEKHGTLYDYSKTHYKNSRTKVIITCPIHGQFLQKPHNHLEGQGCKECGRIRTADKNTMTQSQYIEKVNRVHNHAYNYTRTVYVHNGEKITITCKTHGDFKQTAYSHAFGQGCPKCGGLSTANSHRYNTYIFVERSNKKHNYLYNYSKTNYIGNEEKVAIECSVHGYFQQAPVSHLAGHGCPKCGNESHWKRSEYIKKAEGRNCIFYTLRCFNETECFYKIGMTMYTVQERYKQTRKMPYNYEIISEIYGEAGFIWDMELSEKRKLKDFNYQPNIVFGGSKTECFTQYKNK